jgi:hypothetical protein
MTGCMFTSLNVVRIAAVDCDLHEALGDALRSRDIGTRCSGRAPSVQRGASRRGFALRGRARRERRAGGRGASPAASTSPLVMRPPRPVPATVAGSTRASAIILRARESPGSGERTVRGGAVRSAGAAPRARACRRGAGVAAGALASVSMTAMTSFRRDRRAVGLLDLDQHTVARRRQFQHDLVRLDRRSGSRSRLTACPGCLCQLTSVASPPIPAAAAP